MSEASLEPAMVPNASRRRVDPDAQPISVSIVSTPRNRAALVIALIVLLACVLLVPFVSGLFGALLLYVVARRPYQRLARRIPAPIAAATMIVGILVLIIAPLVWLIVHLVEEAPSAVAAVQQSGLVAWLNQLRVGDAVIGEEIGKATGTIVSWLSGQAFTLVSGAQSALLNIVISLFGLYYLLNGPNGRWETVREYIPFSAQTADTLRDRFFAVTDATVLGSGLVAVVQGMLIALAFAMTGLLDPLFWGAVALLAAFVPLVGSTLVWLPAALLLLSQHRYGAAALMCVMGAVIAGNVDQVLRPLVYRRMTNIHPMITLVGALAGIDQFGLIGLLLGPLAIALVFELLRFFREEYV
jgi:predicted PurR-regulated permease PerM